MAETDIDLECRNVVKRFGAFTAVDGISFAIAKGSFFSILGPSGCGKTTLLRMLAGFADPDGGDILIKGASVLKTPPNRRPANLVFQHLALFPMMNVQENVAYGLKRRGVGKAEIRDRVKAVLARVGLPDSGPKSINALSGGQKQRIAIARAMVLEPAVLLLDEPLGALDLKLREHMKVELKLLQQQFATTFVYITHDQSEALVMSDQVAVMNAGHFEQVGTPQDLYNRPQTDFVAGFVGDSNRLAGTVVFAEGATVRLRTDGGLELIGNACDGDFRVGERLHAFIRPQAVSLQHGTGPLGNDLAGTVESPLFNGANSQVIVRLSSGEDLLVALPGTLSLASFERGAPLDLSVAAGAVSCFHAGPR